MNLTSGPADDSYSPAWSANGGGVAFGRGANMENPGVWVRYNDGRIVRLFGGYDPAWY